MLSHALLCFASICWELSAYPGVEANNTSLIVYFTNNSTVLEIGSLYFMFHIFSFWLDSNSLPIFVSRREIQCLYRLSLDDTFSRAEGGKSSLQVAYALYVCV